MSGHSKWATIKRSKGANDAKRGQLFTKLGHEIAVAAREGGPDPDANFRLRIVLDNARRANMPKDNIERAIARGTGQLQDGAVLEEAIFEGYGPNGTAFMVLTLSDNRNRTVSDVRRTFTRYAGNLGSDGCVAWMFSRKGTIAIEPGDEDPDEVALMAIDAGAEDVEIEEDLVQVYTEPSDLKTVQEALQDASFKVAEANLAWIPQSTVSLDEKATVQSLKLIEALEELNDVQEVYTNLDISDEAMAKFAGEAA
jgi:YebC/PmpR family DNA-binding regulatory protein